MNPEKQQPTEPDFEAIERALARAAKKARLLAWQTQTPFYVIEDGKMVDLTPREKPPILPDFMKE
jgi:hypothetical protein